MGGPGQASSGLRVCWKLLADLPLRGLPLPELRESWSPRACLFAQPGSLSLVALASYPGPTTL